ncbi:MAG: restriction endonuclease subunit S, partial [Clostridium sp.]
MNGNEKNSPKRRFAEFEDNQYWERKKLKNIANFAKGQGYSKSDLTDVGTPVILYGRLYTKYQSTICRVDTFTIPKSSSVYSTGNEVIVPASGETSEDIARASAVVESGILIGGDLNIIYPSKEIDTVFLSLSISNGTQKKELSKKAQGKSVVHLHNSDLKGVSITFPSIEEQKKIVSAIGNIDKIINTHQSKLEKMKVLKKAYLKEMFPAEGENKPKLRLAGFSDEWEQRKLGEVLKYEQPTKYIVKNTDYNDE